MVQFLKGSNEVPEGEKAEEVGNFNWHEFNLQPLKG